ncbi:FG-GAP-like repeat-containing protein [Arthrobacter sp. 18067]|uniref:FG-GAP-like repeat-containing protein n=1 Tax=Arthrobacter sp. 18067 TaxID=2681413 RepID=UPI001358A91B|nr:FG-GAP-like repeat-containing protein [Arthrobacter sp. 18067]
MAALGFSTLFSRSAGKRLSAGLLAVVVVAALLSVLAPETGHADVDWGRREVGRTPSGLAVNQVTNTTYVPNLDDGTVSVMGKYGEVTATISTVSQPRIAVVNTVTNKVYVAHSGGQVSIIDGTTNAITTVTTNGNRPGIAINEKTNQVYVASPNLLSIIDGTTNGLRSIATGVNGSNVAINNVTNKVYIAGTDGKVAVVDVATSVVTKVQAGTSGDGIAVNSQTGTIYVTNPAADTVTSIEGVTNRLTTYSTGDEPRAIGINKTTNQIYVLNLAGASLSVLDGSTQKITHHPTSQYPRYLAVNESSNKVYITEGYSVRVFNGSTHSSGLVRLTNKSAGEIAINEKTNTIYVSDREDESIRVIDGTNHPVMINSAPPVETGMVNEFYRAWIDGYGSLTPAHKILDGTLPPGLSLLENGFLSGIPTKTGKYTFRVIVSNGASPDVVSPAYTITIAEKEARHDFNGDKAEDVLARDAQGALWLYPGNGRGGWNARVKVGQGWQVMNSIVAPGDFNGDGPVDLMAYDFSGVLWLYPGNGRAGWLPRIRIGEGWGGMRNMTASGDLERDGNPDIVTNSSGDLLHYRGDGKGGWWTGYAIGGGWNIMNHLVGPGDIDGDGLQDLLARDGQGNLWHYGGEKTHTTYRPQGIVGVGWNAMSAIVGPGDFNGDGNVDLLARDSAGTLWLYPGNGKSGWLPRVQVGSGWNVMNAII